jgi:hypothetical protein
VCKAPRPGGDKEPLPHRWNVHAADSDEFEKGYWMPLTCSDACRRAGGYRIWR